MAYVFGAFQLCPTSGHTAVRAGSYNGGAGRVATDPGVRRSERIYREEIRAEVIVNPCAETLIAQNFGDHRRF